MTRVRPGLHIRALQEAGDDKSGKSHRKQKIPPVKYSEG